MAERHSFEVLWTEIAASDLESIVGFVAQRNPQNALALWGKIRRRVEGLAAAPFRSRLVPELKAIGLDVYRELIIEPFRVLVRVQGKKVLVLGVFDGRRDLEEVLFERLTRL